LGAGLGDLPLFATIAEDDEPTELTLADRLLAVDLDALSPREALDLLYELATEAQATKS